MKSRNKQDWRRVDEDKKNGNQRAPKPSYIAMSSSQCRRATRPNDRWECTDCLSNVAALRRWRSFNSSANLSNLALCSALASAFCRFFSSDLRAFSALLSSLRAVFDVTTLAVGDADHALSSTLGALLGPGEMKRFNVDDFAGRELLIDV